MRESISFSKDFISGIRKEKVKYKDIVPARGIFKVQLFDDLTGRKVYEAESENRITAALGNVAYMEMIYNSILDNTSPGYISKVYNNNYSYAPNRVLVLSDTTMEENQYDPFIYGEVIGYSDLWTAYSGSSSLRGTINLSESQRYDNTKHFVVDFPTHAANGTFNSIYTLGSTGSSSPYTPRLNSIYYDYNFVSSKGSWVFDKVNICIDEEKLYVLKVDNTKIGVFDKKQLDFIKEVTISKTCRAITYDRVGNLWGLSTNGKSVYKFSKDDFSLLETINVPASGYYSYSNTAIDICANEGFIYIIQQGRNSSSESTTTMIAKLGKDGVYFNKINLGGYNDYYISKLRSGSEFMVASKSERVYCLDENLEIIYNHLASWSKVIQGDYSYAEDFTYDWENGVVYSGYYSGSSTGNNYLRKGYFVPALSHTLLPEPITKTPTNTMKIQYDITVDRVGVFDMPEH